MKPNYLTIQHKLKSINKNLYIVGGFCRDKVLGRISDGDIDLVTEATPDEMKKVLKVVGEVGKKYGTYIVTEGGDSYELTTFRKDIGSINYRKPAEVQFTDSLEKDAKRRDFTCNSIYFNPETEEFIDPENGIEDINNGIIRFVGNIESRINEDALRILRFIRIKNKYNFKVADENYWDILKENIEILKNLPIERIRQELDKILLDESNSKALEDLKRIGFLKIFIPELDDMDQYPGNKHHLEGGVWIHTKMCVEEMNIIVKREGIEGNRKLLLLWTILLHDIGKGPTYSIGEDSESHYYNHETVGAEIFKKDLVKRLNFSNNFEKKITFIIKEHLRFFLLPSMKIFKARKLMSEEYFEDLLLVGEADNKGRRPVKFDEFDKIIKLYSDFKEIMKTKVFLTGADIMEKYPELEGRAIGEKMKQLNDQILAKD